MVLIRIKGGDAVWPQAVISLSGPQLPQLKTRMLNSALGKLSPAPLLSVGEACLGGKGDEIGAF